MKAFDGRVAVVTGAADGIGLGLAEQAAKRGMNLVLADVDGEALRAAARGLEASGARTLAVQADVSRAAEVDALADQAYRAFGSVDLLCNNAGVNVTLARPVWEFSPGDWEWVMGVNLWGVIHGVRAFLPRMMDQEKDAHILNTASSAALLSGPGLGIYKLTKHAVLSLSETLYHDLQQAGARVGISAFCPGSVRTRIRDASRNRPLPLRDELPRTPEQESVEQLLRASPGLSPAEAGQIAFRGLEEQRFYIFTEPGALEAARQRFRDIEAGWPSRLDALGSEEQRDAERS